MENSLERELREWRAARAQQANGMAALSGLTPSTTNGFPPGRPAAERDDLERLFGGVSRRFSSGPSRRVQVRGQEVLILKKPRRPLAS